MSSEITSTDQSPITINNECHVLSSIPDQYEPLGNTIEANGIVNPETGVITLNWSSGWGISICYSVLQSLV